MGRVSRVGEGRKIERRAPGGNNSAKGGSAEKRKRQPLGESAKQIFGELRERNTALPAGAAKVFVGLLPIHAAFFLKRPAASEARLRLAIRAGGTEARAGSRLSNPKRMSPASP